MAARIPDARTVRAAKQFEDVDRELARLATLCGVDLLDRRNLERVIRDDASVCRTSNPVAFTKMRGLLMMHYAIRTRTAAELGEAQTQAVIEAVVERMRERLARPRGR